MSQSGGLTHTISAPLAGSNGLIVYGTGGGGTTTINLNGANSYTGQTWFRAAFPGPVTVKVGLATSGSTGALGNSTNSLFLESTTTTLDLNGYNVGVGGLSGGGTATNSDSGFVSQFQVGNDNTSTSFSGSLTGDLALVKAGTGTLTLSGTNSYTGGTTISSGTLLVNGSLSASSTVAVDGGTIGGSGTVGGAVSVASGTTIAPGNSVGTLTVGSVTFDNGSLFNAEIGSTLNTDADKLLVSGLASVLSGGNVVTVNITGNVTDYLAGTPVTYTLMQADSGSSLTDTNFVLDTSGFTSNHPNGIWSHTFSSGNLTVTFNPVPEPATLFGVGALALGILRFRRRLM